MESVSRVLIIGFVWPEPNSSAAGSRMVQLIQLFQQNGFEVTFASAAMDSDYMVDLDALGVAKQSIVLNCSSFDAFIQELNPSVVLFDRFMIEEQFGWRVAAYCPDALRILDTEDLHCLRLARQKAVKTHCVFTADALLEEPVAKREIASILRCDLSLMVSEVEIELLQSVFKIDAALLYYLPLVFETITAKGQLHSLAFDQRQDFVFIGNFLHEPNWDAVQYLKDFIWPLISIELPKVNLRIYGAYSSQKVLQLHQPKSNFHIMGRAADAQEVVGEARVVLAPLRFGAGIKGKLLEAMQCGTPSITTAIGAEAMHGSLPWNGFVAEEPEIFASAAVRLYKEVEIWQQAQQNGFIIVENRYLKALHFDAVIDKIQTLRANLLQHRLYNFMGAMLQHHTLTSTKYMSRWIEEKNNKKS
jgi:glycosyltransferase involved in cell wall biosynthesis